MAKAVIFDMDGVLADSEDIHKQVEDQILGEYGVSLNPEDKDRYAGVDERFFWSDLSDRYNLGLDFLETVEKKRSIFFKVAEGVRSFEGVKELLELLRSKDIPMVVASSSEPMVLKYVISRLGFEDYFQDLISGMDVPNGKPAPDIFLKASSVLNVRPADCVVIEDSLNGVNAAKAAGMSCIAVTNTFPESKLKQADLIVKSLKNVDLEIIKGL